MKEIKDMSKSELAQFAEYLQAQVEEIAFDSEFAQRALQKKAQAQVLTVNHNALNNVMRNVEIDVTQDDKKMIIRKCVHRNANYETMLSFLSAAYEKSTDRSKTQKELKSSNFAQYVSVRVFKILNDILKEDFAIKKFEKQLTAKSYFALNI